MAGNFLRFIRNIEKIRRLKADPEQKAKTIRYGVITIILAIVGIACTVFTMFMVDIMAGADGIAVIFMIFIVLMAAIIAVYCVLMSLATAGTQLGMNRRVISWVALAIALIALIADIIIIALFLA